MNEIRKTSPQSEGRSDAAIKEDICNTLLTEPSINENGIDVSVEGGVVTLTGTVRERSMKRLAEDAASGIQGVVDVRNEIQQTESSGAACIHKIQKAALAQANLPMKLNLQQGVFK